MQSNLYAAQCVQCQKRADGVSGYVIADATSTAWICVQVQNLFFLFLIVFFKKIDKKVCIVDDEGNKEQWF